MRLGRSSWRNAGVVAAVLGKELQISGGGKEKKEKEKEVEEAAKQMFKFWGTHYAACIEEKGIEESDCKEIGFFLDQGINPYAQMTFKGRRGFEFLNKWEGIHSRKTKQ